jgi:hypothetical protein
VGRSSVPSPPDPQVRSRIRLVPEDIENLKLRVPCMLSARARRNVPRKPRVPFRGVRDALAFPSRSLFQRRFNRMVLIRLAETLLNPPIHSVVCSADNQLLVDWRA